MIARTLFLEHDLSRKNLYPHPWRRTIGKAECVCHTRSTLRDNRILVTLNDVYRFITTLDVAPRTERGETRLHRSCRVIDTSPTDQLPCYAQPVWRALKNYRISRETLHNL